MNKKEIQEFLSTPKKDRIMYVNGTKYFIDWNKKTKSTALFNYKTKKIFSACNTPPKCPCCKKSFIKDPDPNNNYWFDPCLGILPGVKNACCGHGVEDGYIYFDNNIVIRFPKCSVELFKTIKSNDNTITSEVKEIKQYE